MNTNLIAESSITIQASPPKVWQVLTEPAKIKQYLFGTEVETDWQKGSPIRFKGEYQGKHYLDKGEVLEHKDQELLRYNYWSGFSGLEDKPENYSLVSYKLHPLSPEQCEFTWHQQGFASEEGRCHTEEGLKAMLKQIKALAEAED